MLAIVEPQDGQTLTVAAGATAFTIAAAIFQFLDVQPGDRLCAAGVGMIIRSVDPDSGNGVLLQGWPGPAQTAATDWYIEQSQASRQSFVASTEQVATANSWLARILSQSTPWAVLDRVSAPPAGPVEGDTYLASPTAADGFQPNLIYRYQSAAWVPVPPHKGDIVFIVASRQTMGWDGTAWGAASPAAGTVGTASLADAAVTNAKLANMAAGTIKLRALGAGSGPPVDGTPAQARALLGVDNTLNLLTNGGFDVWQRGTNGTGGFLADRWNALNTTAASQSSSVPSGSGNSIEFSGSAFPMIRQRIEAADARHAASREVTLSLWAINVTGSTRLWVELAYANAADNFSTTTPIGSAIILATAPSTSWTLYTAKAMLPAGAANGLQIQIVREAGGASTTRVTRVSMRIGDALAIGDTYQARPIGVEQALCRRFFRRIRAVPNLTAYMASSVEGTLPFEPMHRTPTVAPTGLLQIIWPGVNLYTQSAAAVSATGGSDYLVLNLQNFSGLNPSSPYQLYLGGNGNHILADAEL